MLVQGVFKHQRQRTFSLGLLLRSLLRDRCQNQEGQPCGALNDLATEASLGHKTKFKGWSSSESRKAMPRQMRRHRSAASEVRDSHSSSSCWCPARSPGRLADSGSHWGCWRQSSSTFFSPAGRPKEGTHRSGGFKWCSTHSHQVGVEP